MKKLLLPLSLIYGLLVYLHRKISRVHKLERPVISVGNITWGGTGKTPVVIRIARDLVKKGLKPAVLTRGYHRKNKGAKCLVVSDGQRILALPEDAGDEPCLIAQSVPEAVVMVGSNRLKSAKAAMQSYSPDVFILDDGFQHWSIHRDIDIVCINAVNPFGNGWLLPYGILREPLSSLKRADLALINSTDYVHENEVESIESKTSAAPVTVRAKYQPVAIKRVIDNKVYETKAFPSYKAAAVSALGEGRGFISALEKEGFQIENHFDFRDHHWYSSEDIDSIISGLGSDTVVITTSKDAVKLIDILKLIPKQDAEKFFTLEVEIEFTKGEKYWEESIEKALLSSSTVTER